MHKYNFNWSFRDTNFAKDKGKVFSCFSCGGGSSMGYKLAGFDVIGNLEIDKKKNAAYVKNHNPKYNFNQDIREFRMREDLPEELYNLDILDGSPPCLLFSMAGSREEKWGEVFKHDGITQRWDDLYFEFIALAKKLQPKVVIAENVKGLLLGNAIDYVREIYNQFDDAGYYCQHFLLDASTMGVPQRRERVFFVCLRKDLATPFLEWVDFFEQKPIINMSFDEHPITLGECNLELGVPLKGFALEDWERLKSGEEKKYLQSALVNMDTVHPTITEGYSEKANPMPEWSPSWLSDNDLCKVGTFPSDYDFNGIKAHKLIGRSVPPVMMAQIASRVWETWLSKIN
jgi:DNA (cytosine-5)-methyltransferase 1